jgi:primase-polymerase (primpol)-like protein
MPFDTNASRTPSWSPVDPSKLPTWMRDLPAVRWELRDRGPSKPTKVPLTIDGRPADVTNPHHWSTVAEVCRVDPSHVGIVFGGKPDAKGLVMGGVDFDHIYERAPGETDDGPMLARRIRAEAFASDAVACGAYCDRSPSGGGLHVIGRMRPLSDADAKRRDHVEHYTSARFFTMTGDIVSDAIDLLVRSARS